MKERIPPLQGLYYFVKAAQLGSFKEASEQLFVTSAAISQQIRHLEQWLGTDLFHRQHRKVSLTNEGLILYNQALKGFEQIQDGVRQINRDPDPNRLSISTLPSFAQQWLVPRIGEFRKAHSDIALLIEPKSELVTFQDSNVDVCVRYGDGNYPNLESLWLMDEIIYPVCHPIYQKNHGIWSIEDLNRVDLIEDTWPDMDWGHWLEGFGVTPRQSAIQYDGSHFVIEGALSVQGVALVRHSLACRYLQEGSLVRIGNIGIKPKFKYYLCAPAGYFKRDKVKLFKSWIEKQAEEFGSISLDDLEVVDYYASNSMYHS